MTVIYNMSIDRADKPWIGDRRFTELQFTAGPHSQPSDKPVAPPMPDDEPPLHWPHSGESTPVAYSQLFVAPLPSAFERWIPTSARASSYLYTQDTRHTEPGVLSLQ